MLKVKIRKKSIAIGKHTKITFQRTLRIPDDGNTYPLPPGLGTFPVCKIADYEDRVPSSWKELGGVFIPMYQREALWVGFDGADWRPNAVKIGVGKINAITGKRLQGRLNKSKQNYLVCPDQPWLDGINAGNGYIRQFVAMPLGMGYTVEGQVTGKEEFGGMQIIVYDPKPGMFSDKPNYDFGRGVACMVPSDACEMGLAAGGKMRQKIYPDPYGAETWDPDNYGSLYIHIVNSISYREITGLEPPRTPVTARTYTEYGLPWFDFYDEEKGDLPKSRVLGKIKSVKEMDKGKGFSAQQDDTSIGIPAKQISKL